MRRLHLKLINMVLHNTCLNLPHHLVYRDKDPHHLPSKVATQDPDLPMATLNLLNQHPLLVQAKVRVF